MLVVSNHSVDREQDWPSISRRNDLHPSILTKGGDHPNKQTAQIAELRRNSRTSIISVSPRCGGKANRGISESLSVCGKIARGKERPAPSSHTCRHGSMR